MYYPKTCNNGEGELIGFKKYEFELLKTYYLDINDACANQDYKWDNVAVVCLLRHRIHGYTLCVTNTHLYYHSSRDDVRLLQMAYILDKVW